MIQVSLKLLESIFNQLEHLRLQRVFGQHANVVSKNNGLLLCTNPAYIDCWWARADLNRRSSPCQGDVITPRPRALNFFSSIRRLPIRKVRNNSSDDFRNLTCATILFASTANSGTTIAHLEQLSASNWAICLALQTEALVVRHSNQA